ncbi:hypothetical protein EAW52_25615 [Pseudomonas sp. LTJR-52]|nr:hypothetical protein EAW52_25615 [Pseudomonas sp. LTJR-52]
MRFFDAAVCLSLSAQIHGTNKEIRETAKRCLPTLQKADRILINRIAKSNTPLEDVKTLVKTLLNDIVSIKPSTLSLA